MDSFSKCVFVRAGKHTSVHDMHPHSNMEHNLYDNDTHDYYDDDSDTLIMDLSDICDKSYDSGEENKTRLE